MSVPVESPSNTSARDMVITTAKVVLPAESLSGGIEVRDKEQGVSLATLEEVESIGTEVEKRLAAIGKKVQMVVDYDNFYLATVLTDAYVTLVRRLAEQKVLRRRHQVHHLVLHAAQAQRVALQPRTGPAYLRKPSRGDALEREMATGMSGSMRLRLAATCWP